MEKEPFDYIITNLYIKVYTKPFLSATEYFN